MDATFDPYHKWLGISPEEQPANHYRLLGLADFEASPDVIEHAADRQMAHLRSFQAGKHGALSQRLLNEVASAKLCLLSPDRKAAYDAQLRAPPTSLDAGEEVLAAVADVAYLALPTVGALRRASSRLARRRRLWGAMASLVGLAALALAVGLLWLSTDGRPKTPSQPAVESPHEPPPHATAAVDPNVRKRTFHQQ